MLMYPKINPVALQIGPLAIHWYGLMYLIGLFSAWILARYRAKKNGYDFSSEQISDLIFYAALGVILGGRLGYMLFYYYPAYSFSQDPWAWARIWEGGMSFHGGLLGVLISLYIYSKKIKKDYLQVMDFVAPLVPIGLGAGRIGNFINGELWGRVTTVPWGMIFPQAGPYPRHPSQLYEFLLEGVLLFLILWFFSAKQKPKGAVSGLFLLLYGSFRFIVEFFRQPDAQLGYFGAVNITMGQILSLPLIFGGIILLYYAYNNSLKIPKLKKYR